MVILLQHSDSNLLRADPKILNHSPPAFREKRNDRRFIFDNKTWSEDT